ncbi:MAG: hypothetical protein K0Q55_817 [Verrucomicrobia bacterium]|jgi:hypothetical protein|nr:hypothetical protein [Verrucomicrobiota bacterium]
MKAIFSRRDFSASFKMRLVIMVMACAAAISLKAADLDAKTVDAELFAAFDVSKNGYLSGTEITPAVSKYDANGDGRVVFEEFTAGREKDRGGKPAVVVATPPAKVVVAAPAGVLTPRPQQMPVLPQMKAKSGLISGRAVYMDGRPMPEFKVNALGWAGEIHLGPSGSMPSLGQADGKDGKFEIVPTSAFDRKKVLKEAMVTVLRADAVFPYKDRKYRIAMHPLDGLLDGSGETSFRGQVEKGVVRDFVLKVQGPKRGFEKNTPPKDSYRNERSDPGYNAFYGGTVCLDLDHRVGAKPEMKVMKGSVVKVTFTPTGTLLDGSPSQIIVRTLPVQEESMIGYYFYFRDIPLGDYSAVVEVTKPDGQTLALRSRVLGDKWSDSTPVVFRPFDTINHVEQFALFAVP